MSPQTPPAAIAGTQGATSPKPASWGVWAGGALVGGLTLAVFLPALSNGFVSFDDAENFLKNPDYRGLGPANLRWMFASAHMGHYIPVAWLTLGLDYALWGMNPLGYHLTSLVLHAINSVLFYLLALRLLGMAIAPPAGPLTERNDAAKAPALLLGATVSALLFSLHPLRVESVAWITERRDLVCGLFALLTVLAYLRACPRRMPDRVHAGWYATAVALFALALLSKSIVVGLPFVLLALDLYPLRRMSFTEPDGWKHAARLLVEKLPFLSLSGTIGIAMFFIGRREGVLTSLATLGITERLAISGYSLIFYLWKTLVPWPLSPFYELHYPVRPLAPGYLLPGVAVVAMTVGAISARPRWPAGLTAWLAYVILLLPVIGITHNGMQIAADRYTYLACLPWALLAGAGVSWCWHASRAGVITRQTARLLVAFSAAVIVALGALSTPQILAWRDSQALWRHAVALDPESALAHYSLGGVLWSLGRTQDARAELELALALLPDRLANAKAAFHTSLGLLLQQQGDLAGAERNYRVALSFSPDNILARNNLGVIYALRGDPRPALDSFLYALRAAPGLPSACANARSLATILEVTPRELESCPPLAERNRHAAD